jgi:Nickel responsive protein SCO4226-like
MGSSSDVAPGASRLCFSCLKLKARTARWPGEDKNVRGSVVWCGGNRRSSWSRGAQKGCGTDMALYLDIHHHVDGLTADAVKGAHEADLATQEEYGVRYLEYWFNEGTGLVFCLVEAPSAEAAAEVHRKAHGLVADEIIEVRQGSASE